MRPAWPRTGEPGASHGGAEWRRRAFAADAPQSDQGGDQTQEPDRPEYHARPLPTDTFTPAESLPEDFPVAIPSDM